MPNTYVALATQTIAVATSTVTFTSIPQGYTDLVLVVSAANASASNLEITFNSDTGSNYSRTQLAGNGSSATSARESNYTSYRTLNTPASTSTFSIATLHIMNYSNTTTNKTLLDRGGLSSDSTYAQVGLYRSTSAISTIRLLAGANFSVGSTFNLYGIANADQGAAKATGGIITEDSQYWYHTFGASGEFTPKQALTCDYLVVAGGGGGGGGFGGGGGGGGFRTGTALSVASGTPITVTVGGGGTGANNTSPWPNGTRGSDSVFSSITSTGGGGGGGRAGLTWSTGTGGSGGGGSQAPNGTGAAGNTPSTSPSQGSNGGNSIVNDPSGIYLGGGGGGANAVGTNASGTVAGSGGNGTSSSYSGLAVTYAGGGGGGTFYNTHTPGTGGTGGGGAGNFNNGTNGTVNLGGGGGGGGGSSSASVGGTGGSGIVIVRYAK
jgi:hypothetical protein